MKKLLFTLCLWLTVSWLWAQKQADPKLFEGNAVLQEYEMKDGAQIYLQVGSPIPYSYQEVSDGSSFNIRFPWDVAYIPLTFSEDYFEVSKGYYSEKIRLDWTIQSNSKKIDQIKIHRRKFEESNVNDVDNFKVIATLSSDSYTYEDTDTQGGTLYEYKIEATGVSSIPKKYITYITGVGYRNPTGVVTGNVSFDGGSPVKDVVLRADPQGGDLNFGSSLSFGTSGFLSIPFKNKALKDNITLQAWVKMAENTSASLFNLKNTILTADEVEVACTTTENSFELTVSNGGQSKTFKISDYYPTGNIDGRGDDTFNSFNNADNPSTDFSQNFVHISLVLRIGESPAFYLNGRNINEKYLDTLPEDAPVKPAIVTSGDFTFNGFETAEVTIAKGLQGNVDEIRLWGKALDEKQIRTDFKRYLGGSETSLISYIRCDETAGKYAYDISKAGIEFNKNHGKIVQGSWSTEKPTSSQLGILGVTDALGNYIISAIPYSGSGESYTITPLLGVHQFEPGQQLVFVGNGSEVINKIDFRDISAFNFIGKVYYTSNGIFAPADTVDNVTFVSEQGDGIYNQYRAIIDNKEQLISKGKYFYDVSDPGNPLLYETPTVYVAGANVYVDGDIVLDKNKRPVVTDQTGSFNIKVPIGEHYIEVRKDKHSFTHAGRFPAEREDGDDLFDFFEHQETAVTFLDTTRVALVGRVVGGVREAEKPIAFGFDGPVKETYNTGTDEERTVDISSVNNIGQAILTLSYIPYGGSPGIGELEYSFDTNPETGEYKVNVLPLNYTIYMDNGIRIPSATTKIDLLEGNETVNLSEVPDTTNEPICQWQRANHLFSAFSFYKKLYLPLRTGSECCFTVLRHRGYGKTDRCRRACK